MPVEGTALLLPPRAVEFAQLPRLAMSEALPRSFLLRIAPLGALALSSKIDDVGHIITCPPGGHSDRLRASSAIVRVRSRRKFSTLCIA